MDETEGRSLDKLLHERCPGQYNNAWVACLDILGYKSRVSEAHDTPSALHAIGQLKSAIDLAVASSHVGVCDRFIERFRVFSDTVYMATPDASGVSDLLFVLTDITARLAGSGIFLRGGIAYGGHYDDGIVLFSPAFVNAYEMEQNEAFYPRIVASPEVVKAHLGLTEGRRQAAPELVVEWDRDSNRLWQDADGRWFLNYLTLASDIARACSREEGMSILARHRDQVARNLEKHRDNPRVLAKYHWLANYHNRFCRFALSEDEREGLLINTGAIRSRVEQ